MSASTHKVVHDHWESYPIGTDDGPMFVLFDVAAAQEDLSAELPFCARVIVPIHAPNENGGPVGEESQRLDDLEDALCDLLTQHRIPCRLVGRITFQGIREIVFQLRDFESFRPPVAHWMMSQSDYEIEVSEHEGWDFFRDCIAPTRESWQWIADRQVIDQLLESGSDPTKPHLLDFFFTGATAGLQQVADTLLERGYILGDGSHDFRDGNLCIRKAMPLDLLEVYDHTLQHLELADEFGVDYTGWGAGVER